MKKSSSYIHWMVTIKAFINFMSSEKKKKTYESTCVKPGYPDTLLKFDFIQNN